MINLRRACLSTCLALASLSAFPQLVAPGSRLSRLETPSFAIYFPQDLSLEARRLASFAEEVLNEEVGRIGPRPSHRLSVLLADASPEENGYFSSFPSDRIVLEIAAPGVDGETAAMKDPLRGLFAHELAHALSLSTRGRLAAGGARLFGDPVAPAFWVGPRLLAEGTAIAAEGGGYGVEQGRATDPLTAAPIYQALIENRRPDFWQASGATGLWPFGAAPYDYGGPFAAWLEERYGPGALAALWREVAALRPLDDWFFVRGAFSAAYGKNLPELWSEYLDSMTPSRPVAVGPRLLGDQARYYVVALAAGRGRTYWADAADGAVFSLAEGAARPRRLFDIDGHVNRLDLSEDGRYLLVSTAVEGPDGMLRDAVLVRDLEKNRFLERRIEGIREAAWTSPNSDGAKDAIIGISARGIETDLVLVEGSARRTLLRGGTTRSFGSPVSLRNDAFAFLVRNEGKSYIGRLREGRFELLAPSVPLDNMRYLSGRGDRLVAAFAPRGYLYRLAVIDGASGEAPSVDAQGAELSGGILFPALRSEGDAEPRVSYVAALATGERIADFDFSRKACALSSSTAAWIGLDPSFAGVDSSPSPSSPSPRGGTAAEGPEPKAVDASRYPDALSVFRVPYLSTDLNSAGLLLEGMDLTESLVWSVQAGWNWDAGATDLAAALNLSTMPWNWQLRLSDSFVSDVTGRWWRDSVASLRLDRFFAGMPARRGLGASAFLAGGMISSVSASDPWSWNPAATAGGGRLTFAWTDTHRSVYAPFETRGWQAGLGVDGELRDGDAAGLVLSGSGDLWLPYAGLHGSVDAEASPAGILLGPTGWRFRDGMPTLDAATIATWALFSARGLSGSWYSRGELSLRLLDLEVGRTTPALGIESRRVIALAGLRGGAIGGGFGELPSGEATFLYSCFGRLSFEFSPLLGNFAATGLSAGIEAEWSGLALVAARPWRLSFLLEAGH